jgi:hypothetical protein
MLSAGDDVAHPIGTIFEYGHHHAVKYVMHHFPALLDEVLMTKWAQVPDYDRPSPSLAPPLTIPGSFDHCRASPLPTGPL